jgi:hypothetical protein
MGKSSNEMYGIDILVPECPHVPETTTEEKLIHMHMSKTDIVSSYLMKITELRDQIFAIGMKTEDEELVPIALNGFSPAWETFV